MTYGVDQCRVCGIPINPNRGGEMAVWLKAQKKPPISEKEWRRRGFLAAPTPKQLSLPAEGCCQACGERLMKQKTPIGNRAIMAAIALVIGATIVWTVQTYAPYTGYNRVVSHTNPGNK